MRVGIWADLRNPPQWRRPWHDHYSWTLDVICEAERLGARSVWLSEHHFFEDGYLPQPLTFAAAIAARTRIIRIGTAVLLAPLRHPLQLAEEAATVDILSDGRLDLGLGTGYRRPEFAAFGASRARRYEVFEEMVQQLRDLWSRTTVPTPIQDPLPLCVTSSSRAKASPSRKSSAGSAWPACPRISQNATWNCSARPWRVTLQTCDADQPTIESMSK